MQKIIGSACLVAGTAIGAGMLALPICLAKLGIAMSCLLMIAIWLVMYYSSLINLELNLKAGGEGLPLGKLASLYSGRAAGLFGSGILLLLSYSLISAYIYGGAQVLQKLITITSGQEYGLTAIAASYSIALGIILMFGIGVVDYINRALFFLMLIICTVLIACLTIKTNVSSLPLHSDMLMISSSWTSTIPVVFTSFGFQVIFHSLTNYCNKDAIVLKKAFFYGSLIPMVVYLLWTCSALSILHDGNPEFYSKIMHGGVDVGDFILALSNSAQFYHMELCTWIISILAIVTSVIGVGLGLVDSIKARSRPLKVCLTLAPPFLVATLIPNAFIQALSFAGLVLVFIAILLPLYLLKLVPDQRWIYKSLKSQSLKILTILSGLVVIVCEIINLMI